MLSAVLVSNLLAIGSEWMQIRLLEHTAPRQRVVTPLNEYSQNNVRQQAVGLLIAVSSVLSGIAFMTWFYRVYRNLSALGNESVNSTPTMAVIAWFIPIVSLFFPFYFMREIWQKSHPAASPASETIENTRIRSPLVFCWWTSFLLMLVFRWMEKATLPYAGTIAGRIDASWTAIFASAVTVPAAVLAIWLVHRTTGNQQKRYALVWSKAAEQAS
jgi:hypothetical protein